jgi:hypothetical protein
MEKIKKALNGAEAKAQHTFGGKDHSHNVKVKDADVLEGMDSETEQRTKLFKANVEGAAVLVRRLTDFAHKLKELAVVSSNFASETSKIGGSSKDIEHLRACVLPFVKLNKLGEQLEELAAEVATLEKLDFIAVAAQIKKVKKVTKHVESLKKKNDAQALTAEHALKVSKFPCFCVFVCIFGELACSGGGGRAEIKPESRERQIRGEKMRKRILYLSDV